MEKFGETAHSAEATSGNYTVNCAAQALRLGWAQADITPEEPVLIAGQFYARLSESVRDPITVTACAMESGEEHAVFVSCDFVTIPDELCSAVRTRLSSQVDGLDPLKVVLNATHTHTGPEIRFPSAVAANVSSGSVGVELGNMSVEAYVAFAAERIAQAVIQAWTSRAPGGIAFGQGTAVVGRNRRWVNEGGNSTMYKLDSSVHDSFRHIEGYEDHSISIMAAYNAVGGLTGLIVNVPCPAQESASEFSVSADWWHETRQELRRRFGTGLFVLPQCSAAGDQSPYLLYDKRAHERMLGLAGRTTRQEIAHRICCAVQDILPAIGKAIDWAPKLRHRVETVELTMNRLTEADVREAERNAEIWRGKYEEEKRKLDARPEIRDEPRWYRDVTEAFRRMTWHSNVIRRFERQKTSPTLSAELHTVRLGEVVFATNPFEYYLDFGIQIKVRSPATQTFLVQLTGVGTYVPSPRSVPGGGYGSVPASNLIGPEGGQQLAEYTVRAIRTVWEN